MECYLTRKDVGDHGIELLRAAKEGKCPGTFYIVFTFCLIEDGRLTASGQKVLSS